MVNVDETRESLRLLVEAQERRARFIREANTKLSPFASAKQTAEWLAQLRVIEDDYAVQLGRVSASLASSATIGSAPLPAQAYLPPESPRFIPQVMPARAYRAVCVDATTVPNAIATHCGTLTGMIVGGSSATVPCPLIDVLDDNGLAMIPGPTRADDGGYIPVGVICYPDGTMFYSGAGDVSPYDLTPYSATGVYGGVQSILAQPRYCGIADTVAKSPSAMHLMVTESAPHWLAAIVTDATISSENAWLTCIGKIVYSSTYEATGQKIAHTFSLAAAPETYPQVSNADSMSVRLSIYPGARNQWADGSARWYETPFHRIPINVDALNVTEVKRGAGGVLATP